MKGVNEMNMEEKKKYLIDMDAWRNTSFDPEKRSIRFANDFEEENNKIKNICEKYGQDSSKFEEKFFNLAVAYLNAESRCVSWAIAGPANFPAAKMNKRAEYSMNHCDRYINYPEYVEKICKRLQRRNETQDDKKDKWQKEIEACEALQEKMKLVNKLIRAGKLDEAREVNGAELPKLWIYSDKYGYATYVLSNNLAKIKRLRQQINVINQKREFCEGFDFDGGQVKFDADEIRWNIYFNEIPDEDVRKRLKMFGFKWSPTRKAWTRGAKTMGINNIRFILGIA